MRPVLDLHRAGDLKKFRQIADNVAALVARFKGSLAAEHGVGIARTEYLKEQVGPELYHLMQEIKEAFDPNHLLIPARSSAMTVIRLTGTCGSPRITIWSCPSRRNWPSPRATGPSPPIWNSAMAAAAASNRPP